jgi:Zn-dependent peptidase ImmA (M78 family)/DNA-binding XRE family transcriptional regulator
MDKVAAYFDGAKLREAREARGFTVTRLADLLSDEERQLEKQSISYYEKRQQLPSFSLVQKMSDILDLPVWFFQPDGEPEEIDNAQNRSHRSSTEISILKAKRKLTWLIRISKYLKQFLNFQEVNINPVSKDVNAVALTDQEVAEEAIRIRSEWNLGEGPVGDIVKHLEFRGIFIGYVDFKDSNVEGRARWDETDETPYILLNSTINSISRKRFTLAYELGRIILHRHIAIRNIENSADYQRMEKQCKVFASSFLMPSRTFRKSFFYTPTIETLLTNKTRWGASVEAMIYRSTDLGMIDKKRASGLWAATKKWKETGEPREHEILFTEPIQIRTGIQKLLSDKHITVADLLLNIPYSLTDIEDLCSLPKNSLSRLKSNLIISPLTKSESDVKISAYGNTTIIEKKIL